MSYTCEELNKIFDKNNGYCIYCREKMAWSNYGKPGERGAWEIDHGNPRSRGGSDDIRNLWACHIKCNRKKSDKHPNSNW